VINVASEHVSSAVARRARYRTERDLPAVAERRTAGALGRGSEHDVAIWANSLAENNIGA